MDAQVSAPVYQHFRIMRVWDEDRAERKAEGRALWAISFPGKPLRGSAGEFPLIIDYLPSEDHDSWEDCGKAGKW